MNVKNGNINEIDKIIIRIPTLKQLKKEGSTRKRRPIIARKYFLQILYVSKSEFTF